MAKVYFTQHYVICQWLVTGWWFSPVTLVSSTNKSHRHDITEILLKVALKPHKPLFPVFVVKCFTSSMSFVSLSLFPVFVVKCFTFSMSFLSLSLFPVFVVKCFTFSLSFFSAVKCFIFSMWPWAWHTGLIEQSMRKMKCPLGFF